MQGMKRLKLLRSSLLYNFVKRNPLVFFYAYYLRMVRYKAVEWNEKYQENNLNKKLKFSIRKTRYYKSYTEGITKKKDVRNDIESITTGSMFTVSGFTSGTTNAPMELKRSILSIMLEESFILSYWWTFGYKLRDTLFILRGEDIYRDFGEIAVKLPFSSRVIASSYHLSESKIDSYILFLEKYKPAFIQAYPSSVSTLAKLLKVRGWRASWKIKGVITSSESWSKYDRGIVEEIFGSVHDVYGHAERQVIAEQCSYGNYHFNLLYGKTEFIIHKESAEIEIVGTGFYNYAMPLIRYATGDFLHSPIRYKKCQCGLSWPHVEEIKGREDDCIITPEGVHVGRLDVVFKKMTNVVEAQLIQNCIESLLVRVILAEEGNENSILQGIERELRFRVGKEIKITFEVVGSIPRGKNGKFKSIVSNI